MATGRVTVGEVRAAVLAAMRLLDGPRLDPDRALAVLAPYADRDDLDGAKPGQGPRLRAMVRALVADAHRESGRAAEAADWYLRAGSDGPAGGPPIFAPLYAGMVIDHRLAGHYQAALEFLRANDAAWRDRPLAVRGFWTVYWHMFIGWWRPEYRRLRSREPHLQPELERLLQAAGGAPEPVAAPEREPWQPLSWFELPQRPAQVSRSFGEKCGCVTMGGTKGSIICVTVVSALILFFYWLDVGRKPRSVEPPPGTPFVTDTSQVTYDKELARLLVRANDAIKNGDLKLAEALYCEAVSRWPKDADRHTNLGTCLGLQKKYDDAEAEFAMALQLNPQSVNALYEMGCNAYAQRRHGDARMYLEKASAIDDKHAGCHRVLGMVHQATGNKTEAIAHYERAIELAPSIFVNVNELKQFIEKLKQ